MLKFYTAVLLLVIAGAGSVQAQDRVISGQLRSSEDDSPLPGVNITIKGTRIGTVTDAEGRYSISAPVFAVLVFSFIGLQTREVLITETGLQPVGRNNPDKIKLSEAKWSPKILSDSVRDGEGIATLTPNSPTYTTPGTISPHHISRISRNVLSMLKPRRNKAYIVHSEQYYAAKGLSVTVSSLAGFDRVTKLPPRQSTFAQGRNTNEQLTWRGADQSEVMSWGPAVKTLEYDGNSYPYDPNGRLVTTGAGSGLPANIYDPYKFFKTGFNLRNSLLALFPGIRHGVTSLDFQSKSRLGVVPGNDSRTYGGALSFKKARIAPHLTADATLMLSNSSGRLMNRGSNLANIMGSVMRTAPTFDNAAGYSNKVASDHSDVYELADGSIRSSAPDLVDNPYGLINKLPDDESVDRLMSSMALNYLNDQLTVMTFASWDRQHNQLVNGIFPGLATLPLGRRTERNETSETGALNANATYQFYGWDPMLKVGLAYQLRKEQRQVSRTDGFNFLNGKYSEIANADSLSTYDLALNRTVHDITARLNVRLSDWALDLSNRTYFSNTLASTDYVNLFPALSISYQGGYGFIFNELKPYVSLSRTLRESPLLFGNPAMLSTVVPSKRYNQYFENLEISWRQGLGAETELKFETGIHARTTFGLEADVSYYNNTTNGLIVPTWQDGISILQNVGTLNTQGVNASLTYYSHHYWTREFHWTLAARWNKYNSVIRSLDLPKEYIAIGGFSDVQTVIAPDQQLGAIYGTTFLKDEHGRTVIGSDGFPIKDPHLKRIGDVIPKYTLAFQPTIWFQSHWNFSFILDIRVGGQVWNGTKAALDYYGIGETTAQQRHISSYIFDGVDATGITNNKLVSFYDPSLPLAENRWVRYGSSGVGEEYIEDGSWVRVSDLMLSYKFFPTFGLKRDEMILGFTANNLFLSTKYSGVDPGTSLFSYASTKGIDLFNGPSVRTYSFQVTIKL